MYSIVTISGIDIKIPSSLNNHQSELLASVVAGFPGDTPYSMIRERMNDLEKIIRKLHKEWEPWSGETIVFRDGFDGSESCRKPYLERLPE